MFSFLGGLWFININKVVKLRFFNVSLYCPETSTKLSIRLQLYRGYENLRSWWSRGMIPKYDPKVWSQGMIPRCDPRYDPKVWSQGMIPWYVPMVWSQGMIPRYDPKVCSHSMFPWYDPKVWSQGMIPRYDPKVWSQGMFPWYDPNRLKRDCKRNNPPMEQVKERL